MLTTAHPIFEHVPASFADPVGLADQQAQGVVSLIVVRYGVEGESPSGDGHGALGPTYDAFVASSGQLLTVARTTPDYRFPVTPASALARFIEHRDAGRDAVLSLFELAEPECARFLETVFYAECLKLHIDGRESAALVARQIARSGCGGGVLEVNDFSDPDRPRVLLLDLDDLTSSAEDDAPNDDLATTLTHHLDGITGRVLLYDRAKNHATLPDRTDRAFDLDGVIEQANRLALARRGASGEAAPFALPCVSDPGAAPPDDQAEAVESYLRERADRPRLVEPSHPHATGLGALVAELQGGPPSGSIPGAAPLPQLDAMDPPPASGGAASEPVETITMASGDSLPRTRSGGSAHAEPPAPPEPPSAPTIVALPSSPPPVMQAAPRHPLATELDRLRTEVFALFEDAVGRDRAVAHEAHVLEETGIASPVAAADAVRYLRALLCDEPPKRWHFFKRGRAKTYEEVAGKLLAFHAANGHLDDPVVHDVTRLWTRLHR